MSIALDNAFQAQRQRLRLNIERLVAGVWAQNFHDRKATIRAVVPLVEGGTLTAAALVDAYMVANLREQGEEAQSKGVVRDRYTIEALRGKPGEEVYDRAFGALGAQLAAGQVFGSAFASGSAALTKLADTDLQLAHSHASRDWMEGDKRIGAYKRVLGPGKNCSLCRSASSRVYHKADLLPIHEHCHCTVSPVLGDFTGSISFPDDIAIVDDPELGRRLADPGWSAAA